MILSQDSKECGSNIPNEEMVEMVFMSESWQERVNTFSWVILEEFNDPFEGLDRLKSISKGRTIPCP